MPQENEYERSGTDRSEPMRGWDENAFWYPTADRQGALLLVAAVLFALHFDELFGLHTDSTLLFGWLPSNLAYHIGIGILHTAFVVLLYLNWPSSSKHGTDVGESTSGAVADRGDE